MFFTLTRIASDPNKTSYFEELAIPLHPAGLIGALSQRYPVKEILFRSTPGSYNFDWHPAPERQLIILLEGEIEIEVGTGETRRFQGGDVLLVEDTSGRGHRTRSIDGNTRRSLFVTLEQGLQEPVPS